MRARLEAARTAARCALPSGLRDLEEWLGFPSVSGDPARRGDVDAAALWVGRHLRGLGAQVCMAPGEAGPTVLARARRAAGVRERPAVLIYGHLDVRPSGPGWNSPPFRPARRGRTLVARGASDDKGQLMAHLVALQGWVSVGGPPCDVVVIVDGAEEIGSPDLAGVLARHRRSRILQGPVGAILISDTRLVRPGVPSLTVSQRGLLSLTVTVDVGGAPVHAGRFSGAVVDPTRVLAEALLAAAREVDGLPKAVSALRGHSADAAVRRAAGGRAVKANPAERSTRRGSLAVTAVRAGASRGSIPVRAEARLDVRLPPGFSPEAAWGRVEAALRGNRPPGVAIRIVRHQSVRGATLVQPLATARAVRAACRAGFGVDPEPVASGGSIPAVDILRRAFGVAPLLLGLGPADDRAHGPNEYLDLDDWARGVDSSVVFLEAVARSSRVMTDENRVLRARTTLRRHGHQTDDRSAIWVPILGRGGLRPQSRPGGCR